MANKSLFASLTSRLPRANAVNEAGVLAYKLEANHAMAQVAATGTFGNAFYSMAETQLAEVLKLIDEVATTSTWRSWLCTLVRRRS